LEGRTANLLDRFQEVGLSAEKGPPFEAVMPMSGTCKSSSYWRSGGQDPPISPQFSICSEVNLFADETSGLGAENDRCDSENYVGHRKA
jgi:hypothetical protein